MKCRTGHITPPCGYRIDGITDIHLLDFEDFIGFRFHGGGNYDNCFVTGIAHSGEFVEIYTPDSAKYSSSLQNGIHTHTVETFTGDLSAYQQAQLQLASKKRNIVTFHTKSGRKFVVGYEAGASVTFSNQTSEGTGALVQITARSIYPLFEVMEVAVSWNSFVNVWDYVPTLTICEWGGFVNVWEEVCFNDFSTDFSKDFNCESPEYVPPVEVYEWGDFANIWERVCFDDFNTDFNTDFKCN